MAETFEHKPTVWTAAQLREALKDLPDDAPIYIGVAESPDSFAGYQERVLVGAEDANYRQDTVELVFTLFADFEAGRYDWDVS